MTTEKDYSNTIAIIGAGPGGCVLANRILANTEHEVVLLERGPDTATEVATDLSCFPAGLNQNAEWNSSEPQTGLSDRLVWCHTASGLGGGSILNAGVFMAGNKANYQHWPGKHFPAKNFDRAVREICKIHKPQVISSGLLPTDTPAGKIETEIQKQFGFEGTTSKNLLWMEEDGIYFCNSSSNGKEGTAKKTRRTAFDSFLSEEICANKRLTILPNARVTRLLTEQDGDDAIKVTGFEYETTSNTAWGYKLSTSRNKLVGFREVVCSSGAIGTPRLLLASGIGPKTELEAAGIPMVLEVDAVGKELRDHPIAVFPVEMVDAESPQNFPPCCTPADCNATVKTYGDNKKVVFYHMSPHIAYHVHGEILVPKFQSSGLARKLQVFMLNILRNQIYPKSNTKLGIATVGLLSVKSKGSVGLQSIDPGYFREQEDMETFADAFNDMLQMLRNAGMKIAVPDFDMNPKDREALIASIRMLAGPFWHFAGSCAMGRVVDPDSLKVKGTKNLRIVDASIIPTNVEANTQAPVMAMAYLVGELF